MRITDRISAALTGVRCPSCHHIVVPQIPVAPADAAEPTGGRWSYIWLPPSGPVCPDCQFPLARYASRLVWLRIFLAAVILLTGGVFLAILGMLSHAPWIPGVRNVTVATGTVALVIGGAGLVIGRRRR